ncbi:hypothetical protein CROQUDRAFT_77304 [Cronartium quercuum f. sp. fusiforme G11]|uniref:SET domain-containing protein n=1 Tax=Cronartium quercuum f. sp. fusiforme G11 TaxID=708437 RepID=A0A9P6NNT1_9BASI|nr:hypothetical protein CROQUDRAFT_77304 [Cronartium quercuum f. sp. fusiforme G11]
MPRRSSSTSNQPRDALTQAEKLTRTDDLMSDVLDSCLWPNEPFRTPEESNQIQRKRTIKFTPAYRRPRSLNIDDIKIIISRVQAGEIKNISEATLLIRQIPAVMSYIGKGEPPRVGKHIGLYLQLFQSKCGVKFCETDRYDQRRLSSLENGSTTQPHTIPSTRASSCTPIDSLGDGGNNSLDLGTITDSTIESSTPTATRRSRKSKKSTNSTTTSNPTHRIHLAVFATRSYLPNEIIIGCEGSYADLTEEEDLRLRGINPPIEGHPDFSHLVNSRGKFQVFCGPARFVNHDCENNVILLREGFTIKFKVIKPIKIGEEIVTSYGANYFGEGNRECMCQTCEIEGRGVYSNEVSDLELGNVGLDGNRSEGCSEISSIEQPPEEDGSSDPSVTVKMGEEWNPLLTNPVEGSLQPEPDSIITRPRRGRLAKKHSSTSLLIPKVSDSIPSPTPSRSSSLRRHPSRLKPNIPVDRPNFVSQVKFTSTIDLTLPVYNLTGLPEYTKTVFDEGWTNEQVQDPVVQAEPVQVAVPARRKTYWITSKQRQLGLLPWENNSTCPNSSSSSKLETSSSISTNVDHSVQRRYSSITPSLLGPSRHSQSSASTSKPDSTEQSTDPEILRLPKRSYWISSKQKALGILPWDPSPPPATTLPSPSITRATRSSQKAIEGIEPFKGLPSAPRGSRLNFRVIEDGTQEAKMLDSAIGRELLGFRPKKNKVLDNNHSEEGRPTKRKRIDDCNNSNSKEKEVVVEEEEERRNELDRDIVLSSVVAIGSWTNHHDRLNHLTSSPTEDDSPKLTTDNKVVVVEKEKEEEIDILEDVCINHKTGFDVIKHQNYNHPDSEGSILSELDDQLE